MKVSVIIKALNEEKNIARAIESALTAVEQVGGGEVILADSLSKDRTIAIASSYPVRIVQLIDPNDRCCGVGAELGYRAAKGEYLYLLDADMELACEFLAAAVAALDADPGLGGVGGLIEEVHVMNAEFRRRIINQQEHLLPGEVDRLDGGGLFRRNSISQLGYMTNRNLHSYEEYELALRLRSSGWRLRRLDLISVKHYGHTESSFKLLWRRWQSRYIWGAGELFREVMGRPYFTEMIRGIPQIRLTGIVMLWWLALALIFLGVVHHPDIWWIFFSCLIAPLLFGFLRKRNLFDGVFMVISQNMQAAGFIAGIISQRRGDPKQPPRFLEIQ
ncbi:MAG: hypothetical protein B6D47_07700 [Rhodocyclaceae bacterium UTPRO2]|jgi:glycosyltransferase involved in cell wall biosynthesis|nr:MAG: hypothetical protein B6D47_07700 [Rhodocyclaceae bacterium UTPRO2]